MEILRAQRVDKTNALMTAEHRPCDIPDGGIEVDCIDQLDVREFVDYPADRRKGSAHRRTETLAPVGRHYGKTAAGGPR